MGGSTKADVKLSKSKSKGFASACDAAAVSICQIGAWESLKSYNWYYHTCKKTSIFQFCIDTHAICVINQGRKLKNKKAAIEKQKFFSEIFS